MHTETSFAGLVQILRGPLVEKMSVLCLSIRAHVVAIVVVIVLVVVV